MIRKAATWLAVIALAFFVLTDRHGTATLVHSSLGLLKHAGSILKNL